MSIFYLIRHSYVLFLSAPKEHRREESGDNATVTESLHEALEREATATRFSSLVYKYVLACSIA